MAIVTKKPNDLSEEAWLIWKVGMERNGRLRPSDWTEPVYLSSARDYVTLDRSALPELESAGLTVGKAKEDDKDPFVNLNVAHKDYVHVDNGVRDRLLYVEVSLANDEYGEVLLATMMGARHEMRNDNMHGGFPLPIHYFKVTDQSITDVEHDSVYLASFGIENPMFAGISGRGETTLVGTLREAAFYLDGTSVLDGAEACEAGKYCGRKEDHLIAERYMPQVTATHKALIGRRVKVTYLPQSVVGEDGEIA